MSSKLDIIDFINSSAIANHCRNIGYRFSALDMAYLIWASEKHSIEEKHNAWQILINTQPDVEVAERPWTPYIESLHAFLLKFMGLESKCLELFFRDEPSCIYSYSIWYPGDEDYVQDRCIYPNFQLCFDAIQTGLADVLERIHDNIRYIKVEKQWANQSSSEAARSMTVYVDSTGNPWFLCESYGVLSETEIEILDAFRGMWPEIPTPFKRGDILTFQNRYHRKKESFVLDSILYWDGAVHERTLSHLRKRGDESDLSANIYSLADDGTLCRDHGPCYLDMEYYDVALTESEKLLVVLSGFIKGDYDVTVFLEAYDYLKTKRNRKIIHEYLSAYNNPHLIAAGFEEKSNE